MLFALASHLLNSDALAALSSGKTARTNAAKLSPVNSRLLNAVYDKQAPTTTTKKRQSLVHFETPTRPMRSVERYTFVNQEEKHGGTRPQKKTNRTKSNQTHLSQRSRHEPRLALGPHALLHVYHASRQLHIASSSAHSSVVRFRRVVNPKRDHPSTRVVVVAVVVNVYAYAPRAEHPRRPQPSSFVRLSSPLSGHRRPSPSWFDTQTKESNSGEPQRRSSCTA